MDKTKRYIKMCQKADEIKGFWKPGQGDYFYGVPRDFDDDMDYEKGVYQFFICEDEFYNVVPTDYDLKKKEFTGFGDEDSTTFLPRLEDLQQMIDSELPYDLINEFHKWTTELDISMKERLQTMEQIWLGFVMFKNHSKIWTGKDWEHVSYK